MHRSKLVKVLKKLSKAELRALQNFLNAAVFRDGLKTKSSLALFKLLLPHYPAFNKHTLKKETIHKKLYNQESYKPGKLEKQMSGLFNLIQEFIIDQHTSNQSELQQTLILYTFYRGRGLNNLADILVKKYQKILKETQQGDSMYFYDTFLLEKEIANHQAIFLDAKKSINFPQALKDLDQYYIFEKLELACRLLAIHRFVFPVDLEDSLLLLDHLKPLMETDYFDVPIIKVYYKAYCFLNADEVDMEAAFLAFEISLKTHHAFISEELRLPLNSIIRNYCVLQCHRGVKGYLEKGFQVYKDHLEKGYLYSDGLLFTSTLTNLSGFGLRLKQFDWVLQFILDHQYKLTGTNTPEDVYNLNLANYYFCTKHYEKALDYLGETYEESYSKIKAKRLEIKIYYEMKHVLLTPKMDAFKIYIYRFPKKKITQKHKLANQNFIDLLKQIYLPRTFQNERRIDKLSLKTNTFKFVHEKEWLLEKLEELR